MIPYDFLPHRIDILFPDIRIGDVIARRPVNVHRAIEYLQTGLYRQHFSDSGEFIGIVYSPQTAKPVHRGYIPKEMPPMEILFPQCCKFIQPSNAKPECERTVTDVIQCQAC